MKETMKKQFIDIMINSLSCNKDGLGELCETIDSLCLCDKHECSECPFNDDINAGIFIGEIE